MYTSLPPALAEEVIFSVASVCVCVCLSVRPCVRLRSTGRTVGPTDLKFGTRIKDHHTSDKFEGQGDRSKVKVSKVKNVKITVFSLVSEKMVQGQGHMGQDQGHQGQGRRSRSKVVGQGHRVKVKVVGEFCTPSTRGRCDTWAFSF